MPRVKGESQRHEIFAIHGVVLVPVTHYDGSITSRLTKNI